jgi:hypothetical protein
VHVSSYGRAEQDAFLVGELASGSHGDVSGDRVAARDQLEECCHAVLGRYLAYAEKEVGQFLRGVD